MLYFSKSKYSDFWQCPKIAWLKKYKPEKEEISDESRNRMKEGSEVGAAAKGLFGDFTDVTAYRKDGGLDIEMMKRNTEEEMRKGTPVICEASFVYRGLYCAVDILKKENGGWAIYEVKSSSAAANELLCGSSGKKEKEDSYLADIAFQKYVLEHCGVKVAGVYLVRLNKEYVLRGALDIKELFLITDAAEAAGPEFETVGHNIEEAEKLLSSAEEPNTDLSIGCDKPYECAFWKYCTARLPSPSVFDIYKIGFKKALVYYNDGLADFKELYGSGKIKNEKKLRQLEYALFDKGTYIDKESIRKFLNGLSFPLYFLDFETMQYAIPQFEGTKPYAQIPFQYSLHYIESEGGELRHREFLGESGTDPRRALAERLCADIPENVCVLAYHKQFECDRLKELAEAFPDLSGHLKHIGENVSDLEDPFTKGYYYNREMGGTFSIKSVLPAVFPDDPGLNYANLEGVHNGTEAMSIFPKIKDMPPVEQKKTKDQLLEYCGLDTYAMVKLWGELVRAARE